MPGESSLQRLLVRIRPGCSENHVSNLSGTPRGFFGHRNELGRYVQTVCPKRGVLLREAGTCAGTGACSGGVSKCCSLYQITVKSGRVLGEDSTEKVLETGKHREQRHIDGDSNEKVLETCIHCEQRHLDGWDLRLRGF